MKIIFVGGGTGGHFYPLMAVADKVIAKYKEEGTNVPLLYYFGEKNLNSEMLKVRNIEYSYIPSGKKRLYFSLLNYLDIFKVLAGVIVAFFKLLIIYPDVVFSKSGYDSVPTCIAAFILRIPIVLHDSDSIPGRSSLLIGKLATRIAVSYKESIQYYKNKNIVAFTGQPILEKYLPKNISTPLVREGKKNILVVGGSQGSVKINDAVLEVLPELCAKYNVIHQTGPANFEDVKIRTGVILENYNKESYAVYPNIDLSFIYPEIDLVISRAGSMLFEFAAWGIPAIVIPISELVSRDQMNNALTCQKYGFVKVIFEDNLSSHLLLNSVDSLMSNEGKYKEMHESALRFREIYAADIIAKELVEIIKSHYN
jgi:UDP-N-acetylglucosamine--N-acetylmuramyl-(pentapeptide) pyrophosphoryl-undecaprenol N-acetylglucosamine transferase